MARYGINVYMGSVEDEHTEDANVVEHHRLELPDDHHEDELHDKALSVVNWDKRKCIKPFKMGDATVFQLRNHSYHMMVSKI
jgi:hypothetical protein